MVTSLSKLWIGRCTISEYQSITDPIHYQTSQELVPVVTDEPCRISFHNEIVTTIGMGAATAVQTVTLFIRPNLTINAGSVIEVTQHGITTKYKSSSKPSIYTNHQEIALELYNDKA